MSVILSDRPLVASHIMAVDTNVLEAVIRGALPVTHLEIEDQSNGCGENYAIILVSEVRRHGNS